MWLDIYIVACSALLSLAGWYRWRRARLPLPPGPKGYPIVGNLFDIPSHSQWVKYLEWSKAYDSDIIYVNVLGSPIVVLNSYKAVNDLLSVRSLLYSDSTMVNELLGWGTVTSLMPYGHAWRARRRAFWQEFNPVNSFNHRPKQLWHSRDLLRRLLHDPKRFLHHIEYTLAGSIIAITYGLDVKPEHDPNIVRAEKALVQLKEAAITGNFIVDILPFLKHIPSWMPGASFKAYAERVRPDTEDMRSTPYKQGCDRLVSYRISGVVPMILTISQREGRGKPSLLSRSLARGGCSIESHPDEEIIKDTTWVAYAGGSETSPIVLSTFIAAMLLHPEIQRKAQDELDTYLGPRLPVFEDMPHLPYVRAIMLEALRWQPVLPLGKPILLFQPSHYKGYFIPKGSTVFANVWALLRDEAYYPDADKFKPERFLKDGDIDPRLLDPIPNFGFGRRICPGRFFAMDSIFMSIASTLSCFNIGKSKDSEGRDIEPDIQYDPGFTMHLIPFECSITPRSAEAEKRIRDSELM
ncbi:cytochrome P450 [Pleurotus eryngii]|uniref:Cytochrome P450 n=1 Tax=Pleurotus eryngii TaxID=5323 RepID=A0A9P6DAS8_PLEER|nr:cytochrome P450 [Pleurotus eryngii]